ncbi:hypothetical protein BAE44_0006281, partial [Dichanthelium oligosanthes]
LLRAPPATSSSLMSSGHQPDPPHPQLDSASSPRSRRMRARRRSAPRAGAWGPSEPPHAPSGRPPCWPCQGWRRWRRCGFRRSQRGGGGGLKPERWAGRTPGIVARRAAAHSAGLGGGTKGGASAVEAVVSGW